MRWRDVKKGQIPKKTIEKKSIFLNISSLKNRFRAFVTDSFMILIPILYIVFYLIMGSREEFQANMLFGWIYILVPHFLIISLFYLIKGQTPGYKAYRIKLVKNNQKKPNILQIMARYLTFLIEIISIILLFVPLLRNDRRAIRDILSGTIPIDIKE